MMREEVLILIADILCLYFAFWQVAGCRGDFNFRWLRKDSYLFLCDVPSCMCIMLCFRFALGRCIVYMQIAYSI